MSKRKYINSGMGLYGVGSPTRNLYTNVPKKAQLIGNFAKPIDKVSAEEFLYACGAFDEIKYSAEGDELDKEIDNEDNFDFFPLQNPDTGEYVDLVKNEGLYSLIDGKIQFYKGKNTHDTPTTGNKGLCDYTQGQNIGYVQDWGKGNKAVDYRKYVDVSNETGANLNKKIFRDANHIRRGTSNIAVMRKVDANGNMTNVPYTTIKGLSKFERVCNKLTGGLASKTKFSVQALVGLGKWALSKGERKRVDEYNKARKELSENRDTIVKELDKIKNLQIDLAKQAGNPKDNVNKGGTYWNGIMNDFVAKRMNVFIDYYFDGVKFKNYLDGKCKKATSADAEYKNILSRLYFSSQWYRNYYTFKSGDFGSVSVVDDTAKEVYNSTKEKESHKGDNEFGLTKAIWDKVPTRGNDVSIYAVGIAYWLQQLGEKGFESLTDENSEECYKNCVKVCSYAFWGLYLNPLKSWAKNTSDNTQNTAFVRKFVVDELIGKGYSLANLKTLADGVYNVDGNAFYTNVIISYRWANSLSTFGQYPIFDTDYTLMQIENIYSNCQAINERNRVLEATINNLVKKSGYIGAKNAFCVNVIDNWKAKYKEFTDKFNESSPYRRAVKRGRELKRELLKLREQGAYLESDMEKIEANMTKIKQDIETYQMILDDTSNEQSARDNADKMLDKLTDDLDGWLTKQENKIAEHDTLDENQIQPREDEFEKLGTIVTKVMDIYGSYKRKDARKTYRIKKREVKDELKKLYGKGWRKEGNWKDVKIAYKVERNAILEQYQSVFGKVAHGALAFVLMPARNIVTILLMLNIGGATTRLEQMKNVHDGNGKTSDEIKIRNYYELILQRWYSIGGKKEFLDKIIAKYGKAKPIANKSTDPDAILKENGMSAEKIAEMEEIKLEATGKQYLNFIISEYIKTILGYVKSFFGWLLTQLKTWGSLICSVLGKLFGGGDNDGIVGNGADYNPAEDSAGQLAMLEDYIASNPDPMPTEEQKQQMIDLICDEGYTFLQAYEEIMGIKLTIKTDANGNTIIEEEGNTALGIGLGVGIGILALGGILWTVLSD